MQISGLNNILSHEATRDETFSSGLSFTFKKATLGFYAKRDDLIIQYRCKILPQVKAIEETLVQITEPDLRKTLTDSAQEVIKELLNLQPFAYSTEIYSFEHSEYGRRWMFSELTGESLETCTLQLESFTEDDHIKFNDCISWSKELLLIKNSNSHPVTNP